MSSSDDKQEKADWRDFVDAAAPNPTKAIRMQAGYPSVAHAPRREREYDYGQGRNQRRQHQKHTKVLLPTG